MRVEMNCCSENDNAGKDLTCKIEKIENGIILKIEGKDPKKVAALKKMIETNLELCCEDKNACC